MIKYCFNAQELQEQLNRSIKVSRTATITTPEITDDATARAGKLLGFDSTGNALDVTIDGSGVLNRCCNSASAANICNSSLINCYRQLKLQKCC